MSSNLFLLFDLTVLISFHEVATSNADEYAVVFVLELIIRITVQNRDRVMCIWYPVRDHIHRFKNRSMDLF